MSSLNGPGSGWERSLKYVRSLFKMAPYDLGSIGSRLPEYSSQKDPASKITESSPFSIVSPNGLPKNRQEHPILDGAKRWVPVNIKKCA